MRDELAREYAPWRNRLPLGEGVYTADEGVAEDKPRLKAIVQVATDALGRPVEGSRVLDLGAGEGLFALEFVRHGADVVAIEGRSGNVAKARFVKDALELERLEIVQDDVRNLSRERYGEFDLVLCLGILYHLDGLGAVRLVHSMAEVCRRVAVLDTHTAVTARRTSAVDGGRYRGRRVHEFEPGASSEELERRPLSALDNPESIWLTRASLFNLLDDAGFTSVAELRVPRHQKWAGRVTLLAFRGSPQAVTSAPEVEGASRWRERERLRPHPFQTRWHAAWVKLRRYVPAALIEWVRRRRR